METKRCSKMFWNFLDKISEISRTNIVRNISKQLFSCIYLMQNGLSESLSNAICLLSDLPWECMLATYPFFFSDNVKPSSPLFETIPGERKYDFSFSLEARFPQLKRAQKLTLMSKKRFSASTFPYRFRETLISGCPPKWRRIFLTLVTHVCDVISEQRIVSECL